ncbi:MAG: glycine cleavage system aminomethyltransferase GcvT [Bacteroidales bacterium]|nr:glycine cleavage system aminomethyltransferase GcvT [Bacteroidales bacterium]
MKKTAFNHLHKQLGARMSEFAGFEMPIEYSGITDEHLTVRNAVGVFDVSHMGEIWVKGPGAPDFLQYVTTNDVSRLVPGKAQYTCFPNGRGGIVDDLIIYYFEPEKYMLVVNASNIEKDFNWMKQNQKTGAELENASDRMSQLAIQGPDAEKVLRKITPVDLSAIDSFCFVTGSVAGAAEVIISRTGYTGSKGFEIYFGNEHAEKIWKAVFNAGREYGIKPIGLAARDTLRLEAGLCLYGNDIDDTTSPIEAGLGWITKFVENKDFIDREFLQNQKQQGVTRKLIGFEMIDRGIPRQHYEIVDQGGKRIGDVTSGTMSPLSRKGIGMGYVQTAYSKAGQEIFVAVRNKPLKALVVKLPFYRDI